MQIRSGERLTIREQQLVMLDIMKKLHDFLVYHNIRYILLYGTLLGAIRHKGFIPWDNDMDIGIPRPDYDRLLALLNSGNKIAPHYYHLNYQVDELFHYQITRICDDRTIVKPEYIRDQPKRMGVWVDIFPIDGVPPKTIPGVFRRMRLFINKKIQIADIYSIRGKKNLANRIGNLICRIFPNQQARNYKIDKILRKTSFDSATFVGDVEDKNENIIFLKSEDFVSPVLLPFEDAYFYCPQNWDKYLKRAYGNYMQLPPIEKRMIHNTDCKWI